MDKTKIKQKLKKIILSILGFIPLMGIAEGEFTFLIFSVFVLIYLIAPKLKPIIAKIPLPLFVKFLFLGVFFGFITELFVFLDSGIGVSGQSGLFSQDFFFNFILSIGIYDSLIIIWYFLLKKYRFSLIGVFLSVGTWGVVIEENFAVLLSFNLLIYFYVFVVYASFVSIPFLLVEDEFKKIQRKNNKIKYLVAFFSQFIAYIIGWLWMGLLMSL